MLLIAEAIAKLSFTIIFVLDEQGKKKHIHGHGENNSEKLNIYIIVRLANDVTSCGAVQDAKSYIYILDW